MISRLRVGKPPNRARSTWRLALVMMLGIALGVLHAPPAHGQDDWDGVKPAANQPGRGFRGGRMGELHVEIDQWLMGGMPSGGFDQSLQTQLAVRVDSVARTCGLSDAQRNKLELAGCGDVKRFHRSVEQLKQKYGAVVTDQQKFAELAQEVSPLQLKLQGGLFGESSLYAKVLKQTLDPKQSTQYAEEERQRQRFRYETRIEAVLCDLENSVPLLAEQRQKLVKLLLDETSPPKKYDQYANIIVLLQVRRLDKAKFKAVLDKDQRQALKKMAEDAQGMEPFLRSNGYLE